MNLEIVALPDGKFEVQGQTVHKIYAEGALLAGLFAACHKNVDQMLSIVDQYEAAGLTTAGYPIETRKALLQRASIKRETDKRQADAQWFAERSQQMADAFDPAKLAQKKADREVREGRERANAARLQGSRPSTPYALQGMDDVWT